MKYVWIIVRNFSNGIDSWNSIYDVYTDHDKAELQALELNEKLGSGNNANFVEFYVEGWELK